MTFMNTFFLTGDSVIIIANLIHLAQILMLLELIQILNFVNDYFVVFIVRNPGMYVPQSSE